MKSEVLVVSLPAGSGGLGLDASRAPAAALTSTRTVATLMSLPEVGSKASVSSLSSWKSCLPSVGVGECQVFQVQLVDEVLDRHG